MESEEEISDARYYCEVLENCLAEILPNFSLVGDISTSVSNGGSQVLDDIEETKSKLGQRDVRQVNGKDLIPSLRSFHQMAAKFDEDNNSCKCQVSVTMFVKTVDRLDKLLDKPWNTSKAGGQAAAATSKAGGQAANATPGVDGEEEPITWQEGDRIFIKACTLTKEQFFQCSDCPRNYTDPLSFKRHCQKKHKKVVEVEILKSMCRFPHNAKTRARKRHTQDQMYKHLRDTHSYEKLPETSYRGWQSFDNGATYTPVFLKRTDPDPSPPSQGQEKGKENTPIPSPPEDRDDRVEIANEANESVPSAMSESNTKKAPEKAEHSFSFVAEEGEAGMFVDVEGEATEKVTAPIEKTILNLSPEKEKNSVALSPEKEKNPVALSPEKEKNQSARSLEDEEHHNEEEKSRVDVKETDPQREIKDPDVTINEAVVANKEAEGILKHNVDDEKNHNQAVDFDSILVDEFYRSQSSPSQNDESSGAIKEPLLIEDDSDTETNDTDEMTARRINNKIKRYNNRLKEEVTVDVCDNPLNAQFIDEFTKYVASNTASEDESVSTVSFSTGLLFRYEDSYLRWLTNKNPDFNLSRWVNFLDEKQLLELKDPIPWVKDNEQEQPSRKKEKLKIHRRIREFLISKIKEVDFPTDVFSQLRRRLLIENIESLGKEINQSKIWSKLNSQIETNRRAVRNAKEILNPTRSVNMSAANSKYFASAQFKKRMDAGNADYDNAMATKSVQAKAFNDFGNLTRHVLLFYDRNRNSAYQMLNIEYQAKRSAWFPDGYNQGEEFTGMPSNWNMFEQPSNQREPDAFVVKVLASRHKKLKLSQDCDVVIFPFVAKMMQQYRELKELAHGETAMDPDLPFFVTFRQKPFSPISNRKGSILEEYSLVNDIPGLTPTTLRQTLEPFVQGSHAMKTRSKDVTSHSSETGRHYYDQTSSQFRVSSLHFVSNKEGILNQTEIEDEVSDELAAKRQKMNEDDINVSRQQALATLKKNKVTKQVKLGKNVKLLPHNREFIQAIFSNTGVLSGLGLHSNKFPNNMRFKMIFYRAVDSGEGLSAEEWDRFKKIEHETFLHLKEDIISDTGGAWLNDLDQNKAADLEVAKAIRSSLSHYERNRKDTDPKFFKF